MGDFSLSTSQELFVLAILAGLPADTHPSNIDIFSYVSVQSSLSSNHSRRLRNIQMLSSMQLNTSLAVQFQISIIIPQAMSYSQYNSMVFVNSAVSNFTLYVENGTFSTTLLELGMEYNISTFDGFYIIANEFSVSALELFSLLVPSSLPTTIPSSLPTSMPIIIVPSYNIPIYFLVAAVIGTMLLVGICVCLCCRINKNKRKIHEMMRFAKMAAIYTEQLDRR